MFLSLKLDVGGMNPQSCITFPVGVTIYYLDKIINVNSEHVGILKNKNRKENQIYYSHNLNIIS